IVAGWNGLPFENQYRRGGGTPRFLRQALGGGESTPDYEGFSVEGVKLSRVPEHQPDIYLAALRPGMLHLAGKEADGVILNWLSPDDVPTSVAEVEQAGGGGKGVAARIFVIPSED